MSQTYEYCNESEVQYHGLRSQCVSVCVRVSVRGLLHLTLTLTSAISNTALRGETLVVHFLLRKHFGV